MSEFNQMNHQHDYHQEMMFDNHNNQHENQHQIHQQMNQQQNENKGNTPEPLKFDLNHVKLKCEFGVIHLILLNKFWTAAVRSNAGNLIVNADVCATV